MPVVDAAPSASPEGATPRTPPSRQRRAEGASLRALRALLETPPPAGAERWTLATLAAATGRPRNNIGAQVRAAGLTPRLARTHAPPRAEPALVTTLRALALQTPPDGGVGWTVAQLVAATGVPVDSIADALRSVWRRDEDRSSGQGWYWLAIPGLLRWSELKPHHVVSTLLRSPPPPGESRWCLDAFAAVAGWTRAQVIAACDLWVPGACASPVRPHTAAGRTTAAVRALLSASADARWTFASIAAAVGLRDDGTLRCAIGRVDRSVYLDCAFAEWAAYLADAPAAP